MPDPRWLHIVLFKRWRWWLLVMLFVGGILYLRNQSPYTEQTVVLTQSLPEVTVDVYRLDTSVEQFHTYVSGMFIFEKQPDQGASVRISELRITLDAGEKICVSKEMVPDRFAEVGEKKGSQICLTPKEAE